MFRRPEIGWWAGIVIWCAAVLFWVPDPSVSFLDAPSASPNPDGFAIFHDLVAEGTSGARRFLAKPSDLPPSVRVLVLLSPGEEVPGDHQEAMLDWVAKTGGTLIIGHPLLGESGEPIVRFGSEVDGNLCPLRELEEARLANLEYISLNMDAPVEVPPFGHRIHRVLDLDNCTGNVMLMDEVNEGVATIEEYGDGRVVQISDAALLGNEALGWKQTHLFASALIADVGENTQWAFDEAHEGIEPRPGYIEIVGASHFRPVFLQALLLMVLWYWWKTARMGRPMGARESRSVRDVYTGAMDTANFYLRAGKSRWALSCSVRYLKVRVKERGVSSQVKGTAYSHVEAAENMLKNNEGSMEKHAHLIREMAKCHKAITTSKGETI